MTMARLLSLPPLRTFFAVVLATLVTACSSLTDMVDFDEPQVELLGLEPMAANGMEARFLVRLRIVNPNAIPLDIDGMSYDVFLRERKVLSGVSSDGINIGAYSEGTAELEVAAGMFGSLALLRDLMATPTDGGLPYRLDAKISRRGLPSAIRVSREGQLDLNISSN